MRKLHIDFETRSRADIRGAGAWKYAEDVSTEILCMAYALDDEKPKLITDFANPLDIMSLDDDIQIVAHNAAFEYAIWHNILVKKFGWPAMTDPENWDCTMARAAACRLPASLEWAGEVLGSPFPKDLTGRSVMLKLSKPNAKGEWNNDLVLYDKLYKYCLRDVEAEQWLDKTLPPLSQAEKKVWNLDLKINERGIKVDVPMARRAVDIAGSMTDSLNDKLAEMTMGMVSKASRVAEMKRYLTDACGIEGIESLDKQAVTNLLDRPDVSQHAKNVIKVRQQVAKSSTAKYKKIVETACADDRVRGVLQYHAAGTGRWGGRLLQPQNLPQGLNKKKQSDVIEALKEGPEFFSFMYGDQSLDALKGAIRGAIKAEDGKTLISADYSAIEVRVLFWLAGDHEALEVFRNGGNLYEDTAEFIFGKKVSKHDPATSMEYKVGKATVLGGGYGMGWEKFKAELEKNTGIILDEPTARMVIDAYRSKYSSVRQLWRDTESAVKNAIRSPGVGFAVAGRKVKYKVENNFLNCILPSGRIIRYFKPSVEGHVHPKFGEREEVRYWGVDSRTHQWKQLKTYGGSLVENFTQAIARDIMANGMLKCEAAGFPIILTVHDELVAEIVADEFHALPSSQLERFIFLMCDTPSWAEGCPITAEGWVGERYRK